jgi:hypothetical protein
MAQGARAALGAWSERLGSDPDDPGFRAVELIQRGRMRLDVAQADLHAAEARLGSFHETTWYFRQALVEAQRSWERLRAEFGTRQLTEALEQPACAVLELNDPRSAGGSARLIPIEGATYRAEPVGGTPAAPVIWRLTRLASDAGQEPYYVLRQADGRTQCDCAEWTYRVADSPEPRSCKHLAALEALGWL